MSRLKRLVWLVRPENRRSVVAIFLMVALLASVATVLHPRFQRYVLLEQAPRYVDFIDIDYIHLTPWSVKVRGLAVRQLGVMVDVVSIEARFSLSKLLWRTIALDRLAVDGAVIDLARLEPTQDHAPAPFPGVLAALDSGYAVVVGDVALDGRVRLRDDTTVRFTVAGGEIAPAGRGVVHADVRTSLPGGRDHIDIAGELGLVQDEHGRVTAVDAALTSAIGFASLPRAEVLAVGLTVTAPPAPSTQAKSEEAPAIPAPPAPEAIDLVLSLKGATGTPAQTHITGTYTGASGEFDGAYTLAADARLWQPYLDDPDLPTLEQQATGQLRLSLASGEARLTLGGDLTIAALEGKLGDNAALPAFLTLHNDVSVSLSAHELRVLDIDTVLTDATGNILVNAQLVEPVAITFDKPRAVLAVDRKFLGVEIDGVPLVWSRELVPGVAVDAGHLTGVLELGAKDGELVLKAIEPLRLDDVVLRRADAIVDGLNASLDPVVSFGEDSLRFDARDFQIKRQDQSIVSAHVTATVPLGDAGGGIDIGMGGQFRLDDIAALPVIDERLARYRLPPALILTIDTKLGLQPGVVTVKDLGIHLSQSDKTDVIEVAARQAFVILLSDGAPALQNPQGELARLALNGIDFTWFETLLPDMTLRGYLANAQFVLAAPEAGVLRLSPTAPLEVTGLAVSQPGRDIVRGLAMGIRPDIRYSPDEIRVDYTELTVHNRNGEVLSGDGAVSLRDYSSATPVLSAKGQLDAQINRLTRQPILAHALGEVVPKTRIGAELDYDLTRSGSAVRIDRFVTTVRVDGDPKITVENLGELVVRPDIADDENLARHLVGRLALDIRGLSSEPLAEIIPLAGARFSEALGSARLESDGERLAVRVTEPFILKQIRIEGKEGPLLRPFTVKAVGDIDVYEKRLMAALSEVSVSFEGKKTADALTGKLALTIEPGRSVPLVELVAELDGHLPTLLDQPVLLPGHRLAAGSFTTKVDVRPSGDIESTTTLGGLQSTESLAVQSVEAAARGHMEITGTGFAFHMPVTANGKSGQTTAIVDARYAPESGKKGLLEVGMASERFFLNDVLASLASIKTAPAKVRKTDRKKKKNKQPVTPVMLDETPDEHAFWGLLPYDTRFKFAVKELFYTDYLIFDDVAGSVDITTERMALTEFSARFHDSPMGFDGVLDFVNGSPEPYDLKLTGGVKDFDLNLFFSALIPENKPRVEGLFGVDIDAFGRSPNIAQYRNRLEFDVKMQSRQGAFRPLPPGSVLLAGATDALGIVGEGLSYVPTGGFGAGAVSRLVNYIAQIDYDLVDVHVLRDATRDIKIDRFLVYSPTVCLEATGGIDYAYGKDVLDSPLSLTASLNMSGKGAAILYSMDLLKDEQDRFGYWRGPEFEVSGTPAQPQSNFADIVKAAGEGTVTGGFTRPISGIIGNIKFRWFGDRPQGLEAEPASGAPPAE